uniref:Protein lin-28 homolog B n=1 Tax=Tursiops truncatus TaxID=9739 RepID=A0A6J3S9V6_TURTR|nr:protein lin-28 homolog B [Tursiops truncatus]
MAEKPVKYNSLPAPSKMFRNGGASKGGGEEPGKLPEQAEEESQVLHGTGHCKWFNVRMGFGFISMINREGSPLDIPVDVFVHQKMKSLKFHFWVVVDLIKQVPLFFRQRNCRSVASGVIGYDTLCGLCLGNECYNCGGLDHHAKECSLPPQPKKCHCCQSITHMVANCPHKTVVQPPAGSQGRQEAEPQPCTAFPREVGGGHGYASPPFPQEARSEVSEWPGTSPAEASSTKSSAAPEDQSKKGPSVQKRKKT